MDKCQICKRESKELVEGTVKGFFFHCCKTHQLAAIEEQCNQLTLVKKEKGGMCTGTLHLRDRISTCTGEWNRETVLATIEWFEFTGTLGMAKRINRDLASIRGRSAVADAKAKSRAAKQNHRDRLCCDSCGSGFFVLGNLSLVASRTSSYTNPPPLPALPLHSS